VGASSGAAPDQAVEGDQEGPPAPEGAAGRYLAGRDLPSLKEFKRQMEKLYLETMVRRGGDIQDMVRHSGLSRSHFYAMLKKHGIPF
jgi:two-component system, NtrC family, response regulator